MQTSINTFSETIKHFFPQNYGIKLLAYGSHSYLKVSIMILVNLLSLINTDVLLLLWISPNFIIFGRR